MAHRRKERLDLFETVEDVYLRARVGGQMILLEDVKPLEKNKKHSI